MATSRVALQRRSLIDPDQNKTSYRPLPADQPNLNGKVGAEECCVSCASGIQIVFRSGARHVRRDYPHPVRLLPLEHSADRRGEMVGSIAAAPGLICSDVPSG